MTPTVIGLDLTPTMIGLDLTPTVIGLDLFQQVRRDSCRHLLLTGMSRFLLSKRKQQD